MSGFVLTAVSFTANHSKVAVCHFRVTKKRRIATTLLSCSAYFVAGVLGIPLVHYVEERGEVVILWFVAVHAVIDCDKAYLLLGEQNLGIKADLKIVSAETAHILDDNRADFPGFGFCKHCLKSGTVEPDAGIVNKMYSHYFPSIHIAPIIAFPVRSFQYPYP